MYKQNKSLSQLGHTLIKVLRHNKDKKIIFDVEGYTNLTNITQFWEFFLTRQFKKRLIDLPWGYIVKLRAYYKTYINPNYQQPFVNNNVDA